MTRWRRAPHALWRRSGGRTLVLPPGAEEPVVFDGVGSLVWDLLVDPKDERDLVEHLDGRFDMDVATIRQDVIAFLGELGDLEVVVRA